MSLPIPLTFSIQFPQKLFLYGSPNCPASFANSIEGFEGPQSYNPDFRPIIDPESDYAFVQNGALVCTRVPGECVDRDGFSSSSVFLDWVTQFPVCIELNRPCRSGEEIVVDYSWIGKLHEEFEPDLEAQSTVQSPALIRKSPRLQEKAAPKEVKNTTSSKRAKKLPVESVEVEVESVEVELEGQLEKKESPTPDIQSPVVDEREARVAEGNRLEPCGECGNQVGGLHKCDVCKKKMHGFCGLPIGEEGSTQARRCTSHKEEVTPQQGKNPKKALAVSLFKPPPTSSNKEADGAAPPIKGKTSAKKKGKSPADIMKLKLPKPTEPAAKAYGKFAVSKRQKRTVEEIEEYTDRVAAAQVEEVSSADEQSDDSV